MKTLLNTGETSVTLYALYTATPVTPAKPETFIVGDVDGDGKATAVDAGIIKLYAAQRTTTGKATVNTNNGANVGAELTKK